MRELGWTHRRKKKSREPYLKLQADVRVGKAAYVGGIFIDEQQSFRFVPWAEVVEL